jgi:arginase family enzyme
MYMIYHMFHVQERQNRLDEVLNIIKSIDTSAKLIGLDFVEVAMRNDDYREATLATQTLFRILSQDII